MDILSWLFNAALGRLSAINPWRIADRVEEVHDISRKMGASFRHILQEANSMADCLAREGFARPSIIFDV